MQQFKVRLVRVATALTIAAALTGSVLATPKAASAASQPQLTGAWFMQIPGGFYATGMAEDCTTRNFGAGTSWAIDVYQPWTHTYGPMPTSRVKLTTKIDLSYDNKTWQNWISYNPQYRNVTQIATGLYSFDFGQFSLNVSGITRKTYFRFRFEVDFVNSSNVVVRQGAMTTIGSSGLDSVSQTIYTGYETYGTCFLTKVPWTN